MSAWLNQGFPAGKSFGVKVGVTTVMDTPSSIQRPYAFIIIGDGDLCVNWFNGKAWEWLIIGKPPGTFLDSKAGVIAISDIPDTKQRPYVFLLTSDRHLWISKWTGTAWTWVDQGLHPGKGVVNFDLIGLSATSVRDTPGSPQRAYVFTIGNDNHLWVHWFTGKEWKWADQGMPAGKNFKQEVGAVTVMDTPASAQRPYIFMIAASGLASDSSLWMNWFTGKEWKWTDQGTPPGKTVTSGVGAVTVMDTPGSAQRPNVFVIASDRHLWVNRYNGSAWKWLDLGTPPGLEISFGIGVTTIQDTTTSSQRPYAYVKATDNHMWVNHFTGKIWIWTDLGKPEGNFIDSGIGVVSVKDTSAFQQHPYAFIRGSKHNFINK